MGEGAVGAAQGPGRPEGGDLVVPLVHGGGDRRDQPTPGGVHSRPGGEGAFVVRTRGIRGGGAGQQTHGLNGTRARAALSSIGGLAGVPPVGLETSPALSMAWTSA